MLQIISGKFFKSSNRYHNDCKGVLYSNISWSQKIETCVATIEAAECNGQVSSYIISYDNQIEKPEATTRFSIKKTGDREILGQLKIICSFALNSFFDEEKLVVYNLCRENAITSREHNIPSSYLPRTLELGIHATEQEIDDLILFFNKIIGLPRKIYNVVTNCMHAYNNALKALDTDFHLAYSMMVYCLESLSQHFDNYVPKWDDYEQYQRDQLERCFDSLDPSIVQLIKDILIQDRQFKLRKRLINFVSQNLNDDFYTTEAFSRKRALQRMELEKSLLNAYSIRSKYVHALELEMPQLTLASISKDNDVYEFLHNTFLTFSGLQRVVRKVIKTLIEKQESIPTEELDWQNELPEILHFETAPQYWVWKHEGLRTEHIIKKYEGLLEIIFSDQNKFPDMRQVIDKSVEFFKTASPQHKRSIYCLFTIYNSFVNYKFRTANHKEFLERNLSLLDECCIENIALVSLPINLHHDISWDTALYEEIILGYNKKKFDSKHLKLPAILETIIYLHMANSYMDDNNTDKQKEWLQNALLNSAGKEKLQEKIKIAIDKLEQFYIPSLYEEIFSQNKNEDK